MKRILIVRTDRIGDVVLSTPVIKAVRASYPGGFLAMMVSPQALEIVDSNPYLNEVISFDKNKIKGLFRSIGFAQRLRNGHFDMAIVLHPTVRVHIMLWLAGIKTRVGLDRKWGFLLTKRIAHKKQCGEKHEIDYTLDVARAAGIDTETKELFVPVKKENRTKVENILKENGFGQAEDFVVIHPAASCPSKRWPAERFAIVANAIADTFHKRVIIVAGLNDKTIGQQVREASGSDVLDLSGDLSIGELAALLEKARLLISNDSGPVHIAVALGIPVVAIFGRSQPGLSFKRWGPIGENDAVLYKDMGCLECLAHECRLEFKCLTAIEPDEVIEAAGKLLELPRRGVLR